MHTSDIQPPEAGRRRGRYSNEFKRKVIALCLQPGVSTAAVALANALNANLLRRWVVESTKRGKSGAAARATTALTPTRTTPAFIPVGLDRAHSAAPADIRIELQHGATTIRVHWPIAAADHCAAWVKEILQ